MRYKLLGRTGIKVSELCLGTMSFGDRWGFGADEATSLEVAAAFAEVGGNFLDTANKYHEGHTEEICGKIIASNRDRWVLATKFTLTTANGDPNASGNSRKNMVQAVQKSLRRLGTDYIDLYQVHEWDGQTPLEETLQALDDLVRWGKVRYVGCSNYAAWHLMKALWTADRKGLTPFVSNQLHYSLQARDIENELVPAAIDQGIGILVWSPIAGGLLSGKYRRGVEPPAGSRHLTDWNEPPVYDEDKLYDTIEELVAISEDLGVSAAQVALAYSMTKPAVTSVIVGARTEEQLADNLAAAELTLEAAHVERLDKVSAQPLPYPLWHQTRNASERFSPADMTLMSRQPSS